MFIIKNEKLEIGRYDMINRRKIEDALDRAIDICVKSRYDKCVLETSEYITCKKECLDTFFMEFLDWKLVNIIGSNTHVISEAFNRCVENNKMCIRNINGRTTCELRCILNEITKMFKESEKVNNGSVRIF